MRALWCWGRCMAERSVQKYVSGKRLLKDLTDNPALPGFVRSLDPPVLKQLIDKIGVEDAAPLVALSEPTQLAEVLDESLWKSAVPGAPETFDPIEFLRWLEVMLEVGDEFLSERIESLDEDLLAAAFHHYFRVADLSIKIFEDDDGPAKVHEAASSAESAGLYGSYEVKARFDDEWVTLSPMLDALYLEHPKLLYALLGRCCAAGAFTESRAPSLAELDAADRHARGRETRGFVDPVAARTLLETACASSLDELAAESAYDLDTVRYFTIVERAREQAFAEKRAARTPTAENAEGDEGDISELETIVAGVIDDDRSRPVALLTGPEVATSPLQAALTELGQTDPDAQAARLAEVVYLSNVLMVGWSLDGKAVAEKTSVEIVMATASLGLDYLGSADPLQELVSEPGLIRLFRIGWQVVQGLPVSVARRLQRVLDALDFTQSRRAWMFAEVRAEIGKPEFLAGIEAADFDTAHESLHMMSLLLPFAACAQLRALVNDLPRIVAEVSDDDEPEVTKFSFFASLDDLDEVDALFDLIGQNWSG